MRCPSYVRGWDPTANGGAGAWQERIYYAGSATSFAGPYTIGYLEWDGARWVRQGRAPVFTATEPWEKPTVAEPNVIYSDGRWRMWYLAGPDKAKQFLQGYAESPDGRTDWKKRIYWPGEQNVFDHNSRAHKSNDEKGREMSSGIDCSTSTLGQAHCIKQAGFDFVVRYLPLGLDKSLSRQEAVNLSSVGLYVVTIFELSGAIFTPEQAASDAQQALQGAQAVGQPQGSVLYFAVDTDVLPDVVLPYFEAVHAPLRAAGYLTGVYGGGAVCEAVKSAGFAHKAWLAQATGWMGSADYRPASAQNPNGYDMVQGASTSVCGIPVDLDESLGAAGGWLTA